MYLEIESSVVITKKNILFSTWNRDQSKSLAFKMKIGLKWKSGWWRVLQNHQSSTKKLFPSPSTTYVKGTGKEIWTFAMFIGIGYVSFCENLTLISDLVLPISSQCCFAMQIKGLVSIWNTTPGWNGLILW